MADDADSHATYSTEAHRCWKLPRPTKIAPPHQETYCLGENHTSCPVFQGEGVPATQGGPPPAAVAPLPPPPPQTPVAPRSEPFAAQSPPVRQVPVAGGPAPARPARQRKQPTLGGRTRGPITMPMATIGLFAIAVGIIALVFVVLSLTGGDGDGGLSPADQVATRNAQQQTQQAQTPGTATEPGGNETPGDTETPDGEETPGATATTPGGGGRTHTVQSGDFCVTIADEYDITLQQLLDANDMTEADCNTLQIGEVLIIPD